MQAPQLIQVRQLSKQFTLHPQGGVSIPVLESISFDLAAGDCMVLDGPSGAGKSTLLRCLYANYLASSGEIWLRDPSSQNENSNAIDITRASAQSIIELRRTTLNYVSQFLRVIPRVSALDIVAEPLIAQGIAAEAAQARAAALLARLNLPQRLWQLPPATFSGGEQQRVNVARGFISEKPIMLLDEPTASLDAANRDVVIELIREACARGAGIIGIFHDAAVRDAVATRRLMIQPISSAAPAMAA